MTKSQKKSLPDLRRQIQQIAAETDVRHLPDYTPASPAALVKAIADFQAVKDHLIAGDRAIYITPSGSLEMNLSVRLNIQDIESLAVARTLNNPDAEMILAVKKPDYLGTSKWELRHGRRTISAKIEDGPWLSRFQAREIDVRPGDAIQCIVRIENLYGYDNELIAERYTVLSVIDVLQDRYQSPQLPLGHGDDYSS